MIKISQTSTCFYFTALEHAALGKIPKPQILYIVLQFSEQAVGHGTERRAAPLSAFPVPHRHSHEDSPEIVLDWALQSSKVCKSGLRERLCFSHLIPSRLLYPEQMKTLYYDDFINFAGTKPHFCCPSHRNRPPLLCVSAKSSQVPVDLCWSLREISRQSLGKKETCVFLTANTYFVLAHRKVAHFVN